MKKSKQRIATIGDDLILSVENIITVGTTVVHSIPEACTVVGIPTQPSR